MLDIVFISVLAWVYVNILTEPGMILGWWKRLFMGAPEWIKNPVVGCGYCVVGQWALWYYLIKFWNEYNFLEHIFFVGSGIFLIEVYNRCLKN